MTGCRISQKENHVRKRSNCMNESIKGWMVCPNCTDLTSPDYSKCPTVILRILFKQTSIWRLCVSGINLPEVLFHIPALTLVPLVQKPQDALLKRLGTLILRKLQGERWEAGCTEKKHHNSAAYILFFTAKHLAHPLSAATLFSFFIIIP